MLNLLQKDVAQSLNVQLFAPRLLVCAIVVILYALALGLSLSPVVILCSFIESSVGTVVVTCRLRASLRASLRAKS